MLPKHRRSIWYTKSFEYKCDATQNKEIYDMTWMLQNNKELPLT